MKFWLKTFFFVCVEMQQRRDTSATNSTHSVEGSARDGPNGATLSSHDHDGMQPYGRIGAEHATQRGMSGSGSGTGRDHADELTAMEAGEVRDGRNGSDIVTGSPQLLLKDPVEVRLCPSVFMFCSVVNLFRDLRCFLAFPPCNTTVPVLQRSQALRREAMNAHIVVISVEPAVWTWFRSELMTVVSEWMC